MSIEIKNKLKKERNRSYLSRDFDSFRAELLQYAKTYFPDQIQDFSEASMGGLFLDMAAYVGDSMSYYLDYQFNELNWATAIETENIRKHLVNAGVKIVGAAPAVVMCTFYIRVTPELIGAGYKPKTNTLPIIQEDTIVLSDSGVEFTLVDDIDFAETNDDGTMVAKQLVSSTNSDGSPAQYILSRDAVCISGTQTSENFDIPNSHQAFRTINLSNANVSEIISVRDSGNTQYYEVNSLAEDTVYKGILNLDSDKNLVKESMEVIPAPYRFTVNTNPASRLTTLRFGGGNADTLDDDIIPDPSELSLPLYGKKTLSRFSINPNALLDTQTLGISPRNTTLTIKYRYGGGLGHNVGPGTLNTVSELHINFPRTLTRTEADFVKSSVDVSNFRSATGGDNAPTIDSLRNQIPMARQMQSRIVSKEDLLARMYTLPSRYGRVFRAGIRPNPNNPLAVQLYIMSRDIAGNLTTSPDTLKKNLRIYLNEFRLISDAFDILDARVINFGVKFSIVSRPDVNKNIVVQNVISRLQNILKIEYFQIDQPIVLADLTNVIINTTDVISLVDLKIVTLTLPNDNRAYSSINFNVDANSYRGLIIGPPGSIFELKYPVHDIVGTSA